MEENNNNVNDPVEVDNNAGDEVINKITLEQFKNALENDVEIKGYYDSIVDKTVNKRLDKGIEAWKEKNLSSIIEEEINKRHPQKTEAEIKFEEQQKALEKAMEEKRQLELQIKYQAIMSENKLPLDILDFVAGKDVECTIANIERFKVFIDEYAQMKLHERLGNFDYKPPGSNLDKEGIISKRSMWE